MPIGVISVSGAKLHSDIAIIGAALILIANQQRNRCTGGFALKYTGQNFDPSTPEGKLMENQLVGLAAYYSRNLAGEVKKGQRENAFEGKCTNGSLA